MTYLYIVCEWLQTIISIDCSSIIRMYRTVPISAHRRWGGVQVQALAIPPPPGKIQKLFFTI